MLLQDRIAIVSGIGPGLGRDIALGARARGRASWRSARASAEHLDPVAKEVEALGRRALPVQTDISRPEDCQNLVARTSRPSGASTCW